MLIGIFVYPQPLWLNIYDYNQSDYLFRQLQMQPQRLTRRTAAEESIAKCLFAFWLLHSVFFLAAEASVPATSCG